MSSKSKRFSMSYSLGEMLALEMALHDTAKRTRSVRLKRMAERATKQLARHESEAGRGAMGGELCQRG